MAKEISYEEVVKQVPVRGGGTCDVMGCFENKVDPDHLLQVIRDIDRRLSDLERKKAE